MEHRVRGFGRNHSDTIRVFVSVDVLNDSTDVENFGKGLSIVGIRSWVFPRQGRALLIRPMTSTSRTPRIDAYLAGGGELDAAAQELMGLMPVHGSLLGPDADVSDEVEERARPLMARTRALLAERRAAGGESP